MSVVRSPAEKPYASSGRPPQAPKKKKISQLLKTRASESRPPQQERNPSPAPPRENDIIPRVPTPTRPVARGSEDGTYATSDRKTPDGIYESIKNHKTGRDRNPYERSAKRQDEDSNLKRAASLPDFTQNNLTYPEDHDNGITDIDDLVRSSSVDNLLSTPAPDISPSAKRALVDELKSVFSSTGLKDKVEKRSEQHAKKPVHKVNSFKHSKYPAIDYHDHQPPQTDNKRPRDPSPAEPTWTRRHPSKWSTKDVCDWLEHEGLANAVPVVNDQAIDGRALQNLTKRDLNNMGMEPWLVETVYQAIETLLDDPPVFNESSRPNNLLRKNSSVNSGVRKPMRMKPPSFTQNRTISHSPPRLHKREPRNPVHESPVKVRSSHPLRAKPPSFSRPGSGLGIFRKTSNVSEKNHKRSSFRSRPQDKRKFSSKRFFESPFNRPPRKKIQDLDPDIAVEGTRSVADVARMFNEQNESSSPTRAQSSSRYESEVAARHKKLDQIFRKKKESSLRDPDRSLSQSQMMKREEPAVLAAPVNMKEITVHAEVMTEGKPELDWVCYEVPENATCQDVVRAHMQATGVSSTQDPYLVLETREALGEKNNQTTCYKRLLEAREKLFHTEASWTLKQRYYFSIRRESSLPEWLSAGQQGLCGRCHELEAGLERLYNDGGDALEVYAEALAALQRNKHTSEVSQYSNPYDLEMVMRDQLHQVVSNCEALKKRASQVNRELDHIDSRDQRGRSRDRDQPTDDYSQLGLHLKLSTLATAVKIYENEEKYLLSQLRHVTKSSQPNGLTLADITSSLYSSLSVSGHATVVSAELTPSRLNGGRFNFRLSTLRGGGVVIASQESDSLLQEGDRLIELNGHVIVASNEQDVNNILDNCTSARIVAMRTESRDKVISSTMEANDLREDMRLIVNELQRESNKAKKLAAHKAELIEAVKSAEHERLHMRTELDDAVRAKAEAEAKQEEVQVVLEALTQAHQETCDHLAHVTQEKMDREDEIEHLTKEMGMLLEGKKRTDEALRMMESEYELLLNQQGGGASFGIDPATARSLGMVEKDDLLKALQMNIDESMKQKEKLDNLTALVMEHAPHLLETQKSHEKPPPPNRRNVSPEYPTRLSPPASHKADRNSVMSRASQQNRASRQQQQQPASSRARSRNELSDHSAMLGPDSNTYPDAPAAFTRARSNTFDREEEKEDEYGWETESDHEI